MNLIGKLKSFFTNKHLNYAESVNGYMPIYGQYGTNIYEADAVQQAIRCTVEEVKKLNPIHERKHNMDVVPVAGNIQKMLDNPNELMTTSDFLEKITWLLYLNLNVFIYPTYETYFDKTDQRVKRRYTGLYPLQPTLVEFKQDPTTLYVELSFRNNYKVTLPYSDVIHIKKNYSVNEYMGGNEEGQPDNKALVKTLKINEDMLTGIAKAMSASTQINGIVKYNTMLDSGKMEVAIKEFENKIKKSESGFLPVDFKNEVTAFEKKVQLVDAETLKFIDSKVLRNYGVPVNILTGNYTKEEYEAFYQKTIEPLIINLSQAFTKTIFTENERSHGNRITFYPKDLIFMSVTQTLEMIRLLGDSGAIMENEKRTALGLPPLAELAGVRKQSLNYVDVDIVSQYQLQKGGNNDG